MPGTPKPAIDPRYKGLTPLIQSVQSLQQQAAATNALSQSPQVVIGDAQPSGVWQPTAANTLQKPPKPTVTTQVGVAGTVLLMLTATIGTIATTTAWQQAVIYWSYTPDGGSTVGPTAPALAGSGFSGGSANIVQTQSVAAMTLISGIPSGLVTFNVWAESAEQGATGSLGTRATFQGMELIAWPLATTPSS